MSPATAIDGIEPACSHDGDWRCNAILY